MFTFNSHGLLTPNTNITVTIDDMKKYFVDSIQSSTRLDNFNKYVHYSNELKNVLQVKSLKQWINGSFVTNIQNPRDIDLVTFIDFNLREKFHLELKHFEAKASNDNFGVDAYLLTVFPEEHSKAFLFQSDKAYWIDRFSRTRRDVYGKKNPKGFLEINY